MAFDMVFSILLGDPLFRAYYQKVDAEGNKQPEPYYPIHGPCKVLYLDSELGPAGCHDRLKAFYAARCPSINFGDRFQFLTGHYDSLLLHKMGRDEKSYNSLRDILQAHAPGPGSETKYVVAFDPLGDFHLGDENDSQMRTVMHSLRKLQNEIGFASIVPHHETDKQAFDAHGNVLRKTGTGRSRGHSSITQAADTVLGIKREDTEADMGWVKVDWLKSRHQRKPPSGWVWVDFARMYVEWVCPSRSVTAEREKLSYASAYRLAHP